MARKGENISKRKDGRWEARYIKGHKDGKAVYGYVFGHSYMEAKEKKAAAMAALGAVETRQKPITKQPLLKDIGWAWLDELKLIRKKSTVVKYEDQLNNHIFPYFGDKRISEITNNDLIAFGNALLSGSNGQKLSPKTTADILSIMKSIRRFALIHGYEVNFIPDCAVIPQEEGKIRVFSFAEEEALLAYLWKNPDLTSLGILVCLFTGLRIGELCALMWSDISLTEQELHVRRTMQRLRNTNKDAIAKTYIDIGAPKSKSSIRTIPIPDNIMDSLREAYVEDGYLLTGHTRRFVEPRTMENRFKSIIKKCGIEDASMHSCRHSYACRCIEAGVEVKVLSELLGHASVNITLNRYVHPSMKFKHENVKKLDRLFAVK